MDTDLTSTLTAQATEIMRKNDRGGYTLPTDGLYPYQWNWDSAFAALGFATFDINRAWLELETLMSGQWSSGMVPHILFHEESPGYFPGPDVWGGIGPIASSGITQPPIAMSAMRWIYERNEDAGRQRALAMFPGMVRWLNWFMTYRLDEGAVCITHPWEAGRDNAPDWDDAMAALEPHDVGEYQRRDTSHVDADMRPKKYDYDRYIWLVNLGRSLNWDDATLLEQNPFRVADPTMTFTLLRAARDLQALGVSLGEDVSDLSAHISTLTAGTKTLWNPQLSCFDSRDVPSGKWAGSVSNASFLCWYSGIDVPGEMLTHLRRIMSACTYGIPSLDPSDPRFDAQRYWRGPSWCVMNKMIGMGLTEAGLPEGEEVRATTRKIIQDCGFAEYFDPLTGAPAGGQSFTWTAAVWLDWVIDVNSGNANSSKESETGA